MANKKKKKSTNLAAILKTKQYDLGGDIGAGYVGVGKGIAGSILPGPIGGIANKGIDTIHGSIDKDITDQERSIAGYGQAAGALGTAIATGGATTPQSIAVGSEGLGQGISAGSPESQEAQQIGAITGIAGQLGGYAAGTSAPNMSNNMQLPSGYENGGNLTEYNGNTHENGGIALGNTNNEVEDKETRWEDYIFSEKVKLPGKDYSFSDASKRINKKYTQRQNDAYDKKALEREMKSLMAMQENERERLGLKHQDKMNEMFGCGGKIGKYPDGGKLPTQLDLINQENATVKPGDIDTIGSKKYIVPDLGSMNVDDSTNPYMTTRDPIYENNETALGGWEHVRRDNLGRVEYPSNVSDEYSIRNKQIEGVRKAILKAKGLDRTNIPANTKLSQQDLVAEGVVSQRDLNDYLANLDWNNLRREKQGLEPINYSGSVEGNIPLWDQLIGPKHLGQRQSVRAQPVLLSKEQEERIRGTREYGGTLKYRGGSELSFDEQVEQDFTPGGLFNSSRYNQGLNLSAFNDLNKTLNPDLGILQSYTGNSGNINPISNQSNSLNEPTNMEYATPNFLQSENVMPNTGFGSGQSINNFGRNTDQSFGQGNPMTLGEDFNKPVGSMYNYLGKSGDVNPPQGQGFDWKKAGIFAAQNIGNISNIIQGAKGAEQVKANLVSPKSVDYSAALKSTTDAYNTAANVARENIRRNATSSGQALSNMIAQNTSLTKDKANAMANIQERQSNQNVGIYNQGDFQNAQILGQTQNLQAQNDAAAANALSQGLTGLGTSVATANRDALAGKAQDRAMYNYMKQNGYEWRKGPDGNPVMYSIATNKPV
jgi:hypothetical protein